MTININNGHPIPRFTGSPRFAVEGRGGGRAEQTERTDAELCPASSCAGDKP